MIYKYIIAWMNNQEKSMEENNLLGLGNPLKSSVPVPETGQQGKLCYVPSNREKDL